MKEKYIKEILKLSQKSLKNDEFPVGAIIVFNNTIISRGYNNRNKSNITYDHAEIMAIKKANQKLNSWRLSDCEMYVSLEPCDMCKKIIIEARINKIYYLISRNKDKYQFKGSEFLIMENKWSNDLELSKKNYERIISNFFLNKRN